MTHVFPVVAKRPIWQTAIVFTLLFWLSGSLILDTVVMPVMYTSGMMAQPGFAIAGYSLFWVFNRIELVCAALILTGILVRRQTLTQNHVSVSQNNSLSSKTIFLASILLIVALVFTYGLTPQMSSLGLQLNLFNPTLETPALMNSLHLGYWVLELLKFGVGALLLKICSQDYQSSASS